MYSSIIGILLYVKTARTDVMQAASVVARFQSSPKETHVAAVKRIFRYLKGTVDYGLWYPKSDNFTLKTFTDAYWVGIIDDRKITSGETFYLGDFLVSWISKKKSSISLSTAEAKYIVVASCCTQVIWMKQTMEDL